VYRHFGPKTLRTAEVSGTFQHHLYFVHRSVTLTYFFNKDYFIDDL